MILSAFLLMMQAAPQEPPAADAVATEQPAAATEEFIAPEPKVKRVCKKVLDTRTGHIAKSRKVCREVPEEPVTAG